MASAHYPPSYARVLCTATQPAMVSTAAMGVFVAGGRCLCGARVCAHLYRRCCAGFKQHSRGVEQQCYAVLECNSSIRTVLLHRWLVFDTGGCVANAGAGVQSWWALGLAANPSPRAYLLIEGGGALATTQETRCLIETGCGPVELSGVRQWCSGVRASGAPVRNVPGWCQALTGGVWGSCWPLPATDCGIGGVHLHNSWALEGYMQCWGIKAAAGVECPAVRLVPCHTLGFSGAPCF